MRAHQICRLRFCVLRDSISPFFSISTPRPKTLSRQKKANYPEFLAYTDVSPSQLIQIIGVILYLNRHYGFLCMSRNMFQQNLSECKELLLQTPTLLTRVYLHHKGKPNFKILEIKQSIRDNLFMFECHSFKGNWGFLPARKASEESN
jgi:hypothetical protein